MVLSKSLGKNESGSYQSHNGGREVFAVSSFPEHRKVEKCPNHHSFPEGEDLNKIKHC